MKEIVTSCVLLALLGAGCAGMRGDGGSDGSTSTPREATLSLVGTVTYVELEGGFYGIRGDDGVQYLPLGLEEAFRKDGLRVRFEARRVSVMTTQQWGTTVRITTMSAL